jgi:hypothetical protein
MNIFFKAYSVFKSTKSEAFASEKISKLGNEKQSSIKKMKHTVLTLRTKKFQMPSSIEHRQKLI